MTAAIELSVGSKFIDLDPALGEMILLELRLFVQGLLQFALQGRFLGKAYRFSIC